MEKARQKCRIQREFRRRLHITPKHFCITIHDHMDQSATTSAIVTVGTRLSYNGDICTVRYVGSIPPWSVTAYGVEWDDAERGKHDGTLNGVRYFNCKLAKCVVCDLVNTF